MRLRWLALIVLGFQLGAAGKPGTDQKILLEDCFADLKAGLFSSVVGAHTEYHYLPEAAPKGHWAVSCFLSDPESQRAWRVIEDGGQRLVYQTFRNQRTLHSHPMLVAGDPLWRDYTLEVDFAPDSTDDQSGVVFRYRNDRCYYFFGVQEGSAVLKLVRHETDFHQPFEKVLAQAPFKANANERLQARVSVAGSHLDADLNGRVRLQADDQTFQAGRIGLTSDVPTRFYRVSVKSSVAEEARWKRERAGVEKELAGLRQANPKPTFWKKIKTTGFGVGRNLRFGDLDGDGQNDVLIGQMRHHGPSDQYSELSCLTAMTFDGKTLWQIGKPDVWKKSLTNDVAFQIHDLDADGRNEVVYCMNQEIIVAEGATGKTKYKAPTPGSKPPADAFPHILGDSLFFCDLRGTGRPQDVVIKDRYWHFWVLNDKLEPLWEGKCTTGHYPFAADIDRDGKDELAIGYALYDHDGRQLWNLEGQVKDHADGIAIADLKGEGKGKPVIFWAASDHGALFVDPGGKITKHHLLGHVQNPAIANFRSDLPGLEIVSINFWGNQGILHFFDSDGNIYQDLEPNQYGSMCLPVNWTGNGEEYFVHSANVEEGGMYDGRGRPVVLFPADGHPDMCNAVLDITGDCRDEVVVWDPYEIWVYTQSDSPKSGRLYKPRRNPLYNYSNYQATVSLPGWSQ
ncbi:MAG: hypothetical protein EHM61_01310 [Acidobacteria bacterium]|nr:MAG: hypothetical protein EHM61_01310 [Acidobacteriota bacterium]